ncbi:hypothetical protein GCM10009687_40700 [Asanoa iriomotensis]|uniref:DUF4386 family protein n=2 Tax=Asanoa iriomotensis TaxID=234613 RepID=A0ABQ4BZV8_9ACTN|nr:hypothetical protein Air01nite_18010 [Asanoa iriomotensis]
MVTVREGRRETAMLGGAALCFFGLVLFQNVLRGILGPTAAASTSDISTLLHEHAWSVHLMVITYLVGMLALLWFSANIGDWCARRNPAAASWARLGAASTIVVAVLFGIINVVQVTMVAARDGLDSALIDLLWTFHNAMFTLNMAGVGLALLGLGRAAVLADLVPRWLSPVTALGAVLLVVAAGPAVAVTNGSPWINLGYAGFAVWLLFLAMTGVALLRGPRATTSEATASLPEFQRIGSPAVTQD